MKLINWLKESWGIVLIVVILIAFFSIAGGCAKPVMIPAEIMTAENECMREVAKVQISTNAANMRQTTMQFKDERNAVLVIAIEALAKSNAQVAVSPFIPCTLTVQAYLRENGAVMRSNNDITKKAVGIVGVVGGIWAAGNALEGLVGLGGATTNISGSRVVSGSSDSSASGAGLGTANTFTDNGSAGQGGLLPRGGQEAGDGNLDIGSNSGDDPALPPVVEPLE